MEKKASFEYLRVLSTLAVVANHVCSGLLITTVLSKWGIITRHHQNV